MGKILSFANQKGGVGKTTSAVNVAASLGILGYKTLLVDMDPQGNATSGVGVAKKGLPTTIKELLLNENLPAEKAIMQTHFENLWLIPAHISLAGVEFDLFDEENSEHTLKNKLDAVRDRFDYVVLDCPPSLGMLTINALAASDGVVVPMQCEFYALEGLSQLMITIGRIKKMYNPTLTVTGILITMNNNRLLLSTQVTRELKKHYDEKLFRTQISRNVKLSEAPGFGMPVYYHDRKSKGAMEYLDVARELTDRI